MFSEEELRDIRGVTRGEDMVEVTCGCTSRTYGDSVGRLKIFLSGDLKIVCECVPGSPEDNLTPAAFERHSGKEKTGKWKNSIWVMVDGDKVLISKTVLLRYYNQRPKLAKANDHRDEFLRCSRCNKERRFRLRTEEECRAHHDAAANPTWSCADFDFSSLSCEADEERESRKTYRGCASSPLCPGCTSCVCFGCRRCRFPDCSCRTCVDFFINNP